MISVSSLTNMTHKCIYRERETEKERGKNERETQEEREKVGKRERDLEEENERK